MLAGVAVMILMVPLNAVMAMKTKTYQVGCPSPPRSSLGPCLGPFYVGSGRVSSAPDVGFSALPAVGIPGGGVLTNAGVRAPVQGF